MNLILALCQQNEKNRHIAGSFCYMEVHYSLMMIFLLFFSLFPICLCLDYEQDRYRQARLSLFGWF